MNPYFMIAAALAVIWGWFIQDFVLAMTGGVIIGAIYTLLRDKYHW